MNDIKYFTRVKDLCKAQGKTIESVVASAGLSLASYNSYRRYNNLPRADESEAIATELGTTNTYLVTGNEPDSSRKYIDRLEAIKALVNKPL